MCELYRVNFLIFRWLNRLKPKNRGTINISSFPMKILERLLYLEILSNLTINIITTSQHAYVKCRSVETVLHEDVEYIEKNMEDSNFTLVAFLVM